ncbi:MAG: hypothetical protein DMF92_18425, partial [Acidobacteria bacterium]
MPESSLRRGSRKDDVAANWTLKGYLIGSCNCDWGCPCTFNARPTYTKCQGAY